MTLNSYVAPTKSKGKKNVLILSTVSPILGITKDDSVRKPTIYKLYDFTKGGTDVMDQRISFYTVHTKSPTWTVNAFAYILDTARVNSQTIYSLQNRNNPRKVVSATFGWNLVKALYIEKRKAESCGLGRDTLVKINLC